MKKIREDKQGYTLVELMVVIVIMAILAASSTPVFTGYLKKAKASEQLIECRSVYMAAESYFAEHTGHGFEDVDLVELEKEIEALTTLDVEILEHTKANLGKTYGVIVTKSAAGEWNCETILCEVDGDIWSFSTEDGGFKKL